LSKQKSEKERLESIDPNLVPSQSETRATGFIKHPEGKLGILKYDKMSLQLEAVTHDKPLQTFKGSWTGADDKVEIIPEKFLNRSQPKVGTCSRPIPGENLGCFAHNGCPYPDHSDPRGRGPGPFNVIIEKDGQRSPCPCYHAYHGTRHGLPTAQVHYLYSGYRVDTEQPTVPSVKAVSRKDEWNNHVYEDQEIEIPVTELGPMYAHHFGKRRQKVKSEIPFGAREEMAETGKTVNQRPGRVSDAPRASGTQTAKLGG
jgi:hypothetical protein